ncbi:hypothetical protein OS493_009887 [Desmophyllum pertusum]|uniref:Uncharacterized protein n=1 Tax=Desmophyllum pertusum TaxID=174260 RepID=A0A9W9YHJ3_9CNID|nr:hypothetical protein OS493_009887 [Desmophyllum pertusum]
MLNYIVFDIPACSAGATDIRSLHSLEWSEAQGEGKGEARRIGAKLRTWEGEGEENWGETESGKKERRIGTRDGKWEGEGKENWDETGSGKEKARGIGTRQELRRRRRGELGRDKK